MNNHQVESTDSQSLINQLVLDHLREKKRKRVWRWVVRGLIVVALLWGAVQVSTVRKDVLVDREAPHVGLVDVQGVISSLQGVDGELFAKSLDLAYKSKGLKALIIRIDSPGGSPVQADYMYNGIMHYRKQYPDTKVYAVCVDSCASAAYYVASAADEIYANPASLVGSIGVLYNGFGFVDTMKMLGVTRRLYTAGDDKGFLDPFSPVEEDKQEKLQTMLNLIHQQFIEKVKAGRGTRLHIDGDTFSGLFWTGEQAKARGLIDGFSSAGQLAREVIEIENMVDYTYQESWMDRISKNIGASMASQMSSVLGLKPGVLAQR